MHKYKLLFVGFVLFSLNCLGSLLDQRIKAALKRGPVCIENLKKNKLVYKEVHYPDGSVLYKVNSDLAKYGLNAVIIRARGDHIEFYNRNFVKRYYADGNFSLERDTEEKG